MDNEKKNINENNTVAGILKGLAVLVGFLGTIIGLKNGLIIIAISIISAILLYAFGEVIELLQDIKNKI